MVKESKFSETFLQNTSIFPRMPKKGERVKDFQKVSCRTHQIFVRKPKKKENQVKFFQTFLVEHILRC